MSSDTYKPAKHEAITIATGEYPGEVTAKVNELLEKGWYLSGPMIMWQQSKLSKPLLLQQMVRYRVEKSFNMGPM